MLGKLFDKYKCDKTAKHMYDTVYEPLFEKHKDDEINILEIGVFKGASTMALLEYFPNAQIHGIDVFKRVAIPDTVCYGQERVHLMRGDSQNMAIGPRVRSAWGAIKFDIIIDDAMHTPAANMKTLHACLPLLNDVGTYFIEDVWPLESMTTKQLAHPWLQRNAHAYNALDNEMFLKSLVNSKKKITRHDLRDKTGQPDSYIIELS